MNIDDIIIRSIRREASPSELVALEQWRARSSENERTYREIQAIIGALNDLHAPVTTEAPSARFITEKARHEESHEGEESHAPRTRYRFAALGGAAAAAAALLVLGIKMAHMPLLTLSRSPVAQTVYETGSAQGRTLQLDDGTLVHMAASSRLEVLRTQPDVELLLDGRAFFGVPRKDGRRVIVETSGGRVTVLGTRFDVHSEEGGLDLLVVDGRVSVGLPEHSVEIGAGIRSVVRQNVVATVEQVDPLEHLEWMGTAMVFQATPLNRVVDEIERRYDVEIEILSPGIENRMLTTAFDGESIDEVVDIVCRVVQVECVRTQDRVEITA